MATFSDVVQMRAGSTPYTFDGSGTLTLNDKARKLIAMKVSHSLSTITTEEGYAMAVQLSSSNWNGNRTFFAGNVANAGPTTNHATYIQNLDTIALDIPVAPQSTISVNISTVAGATQTGTHDVTIEFVYSDGNVPADILASIVAAAGCPALKGGSWGYTAALATTTETALTGNATTLNIPAEAKEVVGVVAIGVLDTAVTAAQELTGYFRVDYGKSDQGVQNYASNGLSPGLGTEVEGAAPAKIIRTPIQVPMSGKENVTRAYVNAYGAITGGADWALNLLWR